jgi:hypothetical protein
MHPLARKILSSALWPLFLFIASPVSGDDSPKRMEQVAEHALAARQKMMQQDATAADVDAFLALCTDGLVYEDPVVNMRIEGRKTIREGMVSFLGLSRSPSMVLTKRIAVANVVVLELVVSFEARENDTWKTTSRRQVTILEFEGSKIRRLADYWAR